jgi:hypothetical protein
MTPNRDSVLKLHTPSVAPMAYHLERTLGAGGFWKTVTTYPSKVGVSPAIATQPRFELGRVEDDGDGSSARVYNALGQLMTPSTATLPARSRGRPSWLPDVKQPNKKFAPTAVRMRNNRDWVDKLVVSPADTSRRKAALQSAYGSAVRNANGLDEYHRQTDSTAETILVDPRLGVPVDVRHETNGKLVIHTVFSYAIASDGSATLSRIRIERPSAKPGTAAVVESVLSNVHLEARTGK